MRGFTTLNRNLIVLSNLTKPIAMKLDSNKHPVLNALLLILNVSLEIVLILIALGLVIGVWELLKY